MNTGLERIWKESLWPSSRHRPGTCVEGLRKITGNLRIVGILTGVRTKRFMTAAKELSALEPTWSLNMLLSEWLDRGGGTGRDL